MSSEPLIAVFVDFENLAIGARDMRSGDFQIRLVLKRLLEKGRIVFKRAYCDWRNYADAVRDFHSQGIELIDIPQTKMSGKNSADIRMVVDALDLCYSKQHIDVFALVSGDSDFSPLVSKLKENNKRVLGCGIKSSTSNLLIANCDEFIYYDDLVRVASKSRAAKSQAAQNQAAQDQAAQDQAAQNQAAQRQGERAPGERAPGERVPGERVPGERGQAERGASEKPPAVARKEPPKRPKKQQAVDQLLEVLQSVEQDYDIVWGSALKQAVRRVFPGFNEGYYDYANFSELLEDMAADGLIDIDYDASRGNYQVRSRLR